MEAVYARELRRHTICCKWCTRLSFSLAFADEVWVRMSPWACRSTLSTIATITIFCSTVTIHGFHAQHEPKNTHNIYIYLFCRRRFSLHFFLLFSSLALCLCLPLKPHTYTHSLMWNLLLFFFSAGEQAFARSFGWWLVVLSATPTHAKEYSVGKTFHTHT